MEILELLGDELLLLELTLLELNEDGLLEDPDVLLSLDGDELD